MPDLTQSQTILVACLAVALPFWFLGLWRAASVIRSDESVRASWRRPRLPAGGFTVRLKLFLGGTLLLFLGFLAVVFFREAVFASGIAAGTLFLTALFFACYFRNLSDDERKLFRSSRRGAAPDDVEEVLLFTHPVWSAEHPGLFAIGVLFTLGGGVLTFMLGDLALLLLSVFGLVFLLHLWSFCQLNTLIVTNRVTATREGLPAERCRLIPHQDVMRATTERSGLDRLFRVETLVIDDGSGEPVRMKLRNAGEVTRRISESAEALANADARPTAREVQVR